MLHKFEKEIDIVGDVALDNLKFIECLIYYDGCLISIDQSPNGDMFMKYSVDYQNDDDEHIDRYMIIPTNSEYIENLKSSKITFYDFIMDQLKREVVFVDYSEKNIRYFKVYKEALHNMYLPEKSVYLFEE